MNNVATAILTTGIALMVAGILIAGLLYREMRTQRVLNESVRLLTSDLSRPSDWNRAHLPIYRNGTYVLQLSADNPVERPLREDRSEKGLAQKPDVVYHGLAEFVVEEPSGAIALRTSIKSPTHGKPAPDRLVRFPIDSLQVGAVSSSDWTLSMRIVAGDSQFAGKLAELIVIPPHSEEFIPFIARESYKLYGAALLIVVGFATTIFGGTRHRQHINREL